MTTLLDLVLAEPDPAFGRAVSNVAPYTHIVYELANPGAGSGVEWYDITEIVSVGPTGHDLTRGADEYDGHYRASVVHLDLYADDDSLAPWLDDTSPTFGTHVPLGAGLLIRCSLVRIEAGVVTLWNPRFTNKVERWGDAALARGQVRRHAVTARDLITSLVAVSVPASSEQNWSDRIDFLLTQSAWPYGSEVYGAQFATGPTDILTVPARAAQSSALAEFRATLDPIGLIMYTDRRGVLIIRPRHDYRTFHDDAFTAGATGDPWVSPAPVVFSNLAHDDPGVLDLAAFAVDTNQAEPFGFPDSEDAVRNRVVVTVDGSIVYDEDDPTSVQRYDPRELPLSWIAANDGLADVILATRASATKEAVPLFTTESTHGFYPGPATLEFYQDVQVSNQTAVGRETAVASGVVRQYRERMQPGLGTLFWDMAFVVDVHGEIGVDASLLPVHTLLLEDLDDTSAEFSWINPTQVIDPTHTQVRMLNPASLWATVDYPLTGLTWGGLDPNTAYIFQVRLIRMVDGIITHFSPSTTYGFTTPWTIPIVDVDEAGDGDVTFPPPPCGGPVDWELQESDDGTSWTIIDSGTITVPPWTVDLSGYTFDPAKAYRIRQDACGDTTYTSPFAGACTDPPALGDAPYDDAALVAYWPGICPPDRIVEAISEEEATAGPCFDGFVLDGDLNVVLVANGDGPVAYGTVPAAVAGITGDATIAARVQLATQPSAPVLSFGLAGLWIDLIDDGSYWAIRGRAHEDGGGITTITPGTLELDFGAWYEVALVHDVAAGDLMLYVDGVEVASALGTVDARHDYGTTGEFAIGITDNGLITNCALWDRVLDPSELPGYTPLTVTINQGSGQADPATGSTVVFDVVFSEAVAGFANGDITLSGTAGATTAVVSGSGSAYTVTVSGMTGAGTVIASIGAGVVTAVATGNPNLASTSSDNTVTWSQPAPVVVGYDGNSGGNGSAMNCSAPVGGSAVQAGDILIVHWTGTTFSNNVPSAPAGWTTIVSHRTGANNPTAIFGKVASGSETTQAWGSSNSGFKWLMLIIRGGSGWANAAVQGDSSSGTTKTPPTVSGIGSSDLRLQMLTANLTTTLSKTGASWTDAVTPQVANLHATGTFGFGACYSVGSGASPSFSWTAGSTIFFGCGQIVIQP